MTVIVRTELKKILDGDAHPTSIHQCGCDGNDMSTGQRGRAAGQYDDHVILHIPSCDDRHLDDAPFQKIQAYEYSFDFM